MAIRYDDKLNRDLLHAVKNYNAKITRLENVGAELLPTRTSARELKRTITDRRELLREIAKLKRFTTRGAEQIVTTEAGVNYTQFQLGEMKRQQTLARRMATLAVKRQQANLATSTHKGWSQESLKFLQYKRDVLYSHNVVKARGQELSRHMARVREQLGKKKQRDNFYNVFFEIMMEGARTIGYDSDRLAEIENSLRSLTPEQLLNFSDNDPAVKSIMEWYEKLIRNAKGKHTTEDDVADLAGYLEYLFDIKDEIVNEYANS